MCYVIVAYGNETLLSLWWHNLLQFIKIGNATDTYGVIFPILEMENAFKRINKSKQPLL